jgi:glycosyltransferase involved in cell wall biosynthesis
MRRITMVIPSLTSGGAERVMSTLANAWARRGTAVTLLTFDDGHEPPFYPLDPRVDHRPIGIARVSGSSIAAYGNNVSRVISLRRAIKRSRPDLVFSFLDTTNVLTLISTRGLGVPVVVQEHTDPSQKRLDPGWVRLRRWFYPRADRVVVLSKTALGYFDEEVKAKSAIIPNPIVIEPPSGDPPRPRDHKLLIALGRLGPEKGYDTLLRAFAEVAPKQPDWDLVIWGDGRLRGELETLRHELGLDDRVAMPGRTRTPHEELRNADLFVMSSRREGFPMALGEAMACGLAAVCSDCESGPRELIRHGVDGLLVPPEDAESLAAALLELMGDENRRKRMASRAPEVLTRFGFERVLQQWDDLFEEAIAGRKSGSLGLIRTFGPTRPKIEKQRDGYDV